MLNFTGDIWPRVCFDSDGGSGGSGGSGSSSSSGKGTSAAEGYGQAAASMGAAGIGSVGGKDVSGGTSSTGGGRAGGVGQEGVGGGFSAPSSASTSSASSASATGGGRAGGVGSPGVGGGFYGAAGVSSPASFSDSPSESGPGPGMSVSSAPEGGGRAGGVGTAGVGGGFHTAATSPQVGYGLAAQTMTEAGIGSVGGRSVSSRGMDVASAGRAAENKSMEQLTAINSFLGAVRGAEGRKSDAYNSLVYGNKTPTHAALTNMTLAEVIGYQNGMKAAGHASTAVGAYQFTKSTLAEAIARTGLSLDTKFSKATQDYLALDLAQNRAAQATVNGTVDVGKFANSLANEWAGLSDETGKSAYDGLAGNKSSVSHETVQALAEGLVSTGAISSGRGLTSAMKSDEGASAASTTAGKPSNEVSLPEVAPTPTSRESASLPSTAPTPTSRASTFMGHLDESRFASTYLSAPASSVPPGVAAGYQQMAASLGTTNALGIDGRAAPPGSITGVFTGGRQSTEMDLATRSALDASVAPYGPNAAYSGMGGKDAPGEGATGRAAPGVAPGFAQTPDEGPIPEGRPEEGLSIGGKIAAGAIDVGLGMVPGVGIAASVVNGGLALTGRSTIGETIVGMLTNGGGSGGFAAAAGMDTGDGGWALDLSTPIDVEDKVVTETKPDDFVSKYLGPRFSETGRPTPAEKWGRDRAGYGAREYAQ